MINGKIVDDMTFEHIETIGKAFFVSDEQELSFPVKMEPLLAAEGDMKPTLPQFNEMELNKFSDYFFNKFGKSNYVNSPSEIEKNSSGNPYLIITTGNGDGCSIGDLEEDEEYDGHTSYELSSDAKRKLYDAVFQFNKTKNIRMNLLELYVRRIEESDKAYKYGMEIYLMIRRKAKDAESFEAEEGQPCPTCNICPHENLEMTDSYNEGERFWISVRCNGCGLKGGSYTEDVQWDDEGILQSSPQIVKSFNEFGNYNSGDLKCPRCFQRFEKGAESFNVEFNEWADQEMKSHGKNISFQDWSKDEGLKHGNSEITDWAQHEDESHDARYGAETYEDSWEKGVIRLAISGGCFSDEYAEWVERQIDGPSSTLNNPRYKKIIDKRWGLDAENWGGDPKGKLAMALAKAREEPTKPLNFEKLDGGRKKRSGILSDPFDESSLDSGEMKKVLLSIGLGIIGIIGYNKWK